MVQSRHLFVALIAISLASLGGCAIFDELFGARKFRIDASQRNFAQTGADFYGTDTHVRATVDAVKSVGNISVISSRALRLPSLPLNAITTFDYQFPGNCGGHHFRVYESDGTQILELEYSPAYGERFVIRDYLSGPHLFVQPGLWTAYDHTAGSIADMTIRYESRGSGILIGTYSQGPVTSLDATARHTLGMAYNRALRDSLRCRG